MERFTVVLFDSRGREGYAIKVRDVVCSRAFLGGIVLMGELLYGLWIKHRCSIRDAFEAELDWETLVKMTPQPVGNVDPTATIDLDFSVGNRYYQKLEKNVTDTVNEGSNSRKYSLFYPVRDWAPRWQRYSLQGLETFRGIFWGFGFFGNPAFEVIEMHYLFYENKRIEELTDFSEACARTHEVEQALISQGLLTQDTCGIVREYIVGPYGGL